MDAVQRRQVGTSTESEAGNGYIGIGEDRVADRDVDDPGLGMIQERAQRERSRPVAFQPRFGGPSAQPRRDATGEHHHIPTREHHGW